MPTLPPSRPTGLSPRVRGNLLAPEVCIAVLGSIPASAGEPILLGQPSRWGKVYPRECGGTYPPGCVAVFLRGLSPRVRGNLGMRYLDLISKGSIPASAGEPVPEAVSLSRQRVYPRECGGTFCALGFSCVGHGLSPRVRGNLIYCNAKESPPRSIPASAGEPHWRRCVRCHREVYPRECGGTW